MACAPPPPTPPPARHLLLISVDTLRADALGLYGGGRGTSPRLDAWSQRTTVFEQAFSHSPKTAPAHMSLLTGLLPQEHGVSNLDARGAPQLDSGQPLLAELLQSAGFRTAGISGGGNVKGRLGFARGFARFSDQGEGLEMALPRLSRWLEDDATSGERWFHFFHTYHVHDPYLRGAEFVSRFADPQYSGSILHSSQSLMAAIQAGQDLAPASSPNERLTANFWRRVDEHSVNDQKHLHNLYLAGVASLDEQLGRWLKQASQQGWLADALVVLTSDHGEEFGEHGRLRHDQLFPEITRVPLLVQHPSGVGAGQRLSGLVGHRDFVPSVLELLGLSALTPTECEGRSWAGTLLGQTEPGAGQALLAVHQSRRERPLDLLAWRDGQHAWQRGPEGFVCFERRSDPLEQAPLDPQSSVAQRLAGEAEALYAALLAAPQWDSSGAPELDAQSRAELEALGYLGGGG
jgi:arylsulfatase A-like enzyme